MGSVGVAGMGVVGGYGVDGVVLRDAPEVEGVMVPCRVGRRHVGVLCSIHMDERACSTCLRWRRKRKISWYRRMVLREITRDSGNLTL